MAPQGEGHVEYVPLAGLMLVHAVSKHSDAGRQLLTDRTDSQHLSTNSAYGLILWRLVLPPSSKLPPCDDTTTQPIFLHDRPLVSVVTVQEDRDSWRDTW